MQDLKITIVQCEQHWEDKEANFEHLSNLLDQENIETDIILLPEMFNTGFSMNRSLAEDANGPSIAFLKSLAKKYSSKIGASLIYKEGSKYFNRFVVVSDASIIGHYDKRHLFSLADEHKFFESGTDRSVISINDWKINLQVCYDLRFPVFSRNHFNEPYDILIYLANWPAKRQLAWDTLLKARSIENQCYTIGVNRVGLDGNDIQYDGGSILIDALGHSIERAKEKKEQVFTQTLSYKSLQKIRKGIPFLKDADEYSIKSIKRTV
jgi:predicted amidohydrolase